MRLATGRLSENRGPLIAGACWRRLPDFDLLRFGVITPEQLHPLVRASLFPGQDAILPEESTEPPALVRMRCRGDWHELRSAGGELRILSHSEEEVRRERALRTFGGPVSGCFAVQETWTTGAGWLPRGLKEQRRDFFLMVRHGDTPGVVRALDAGIDPRVREPDHQRTLLHLLHLLDHEVLLDRLLAAGLDIDAVDVAGRTPVQVAEFEGGSDDLIRALRRRGKRVEEQRSVR
jgi:hypothetical protein